MNSSGFTFRRVREEMIETLLELGIKDFRVLDVISQVPRHIFVDEALWSRAYENRSLTIGYKQTISQPYIVARMTELLISHTNGRGKVFEDLLEIGSGCGYQSAVLSFFSERVDSIERIKPLVQKSRENLAHLKISNIYLNTEMVIRIGIRIKSTMVFYVLLRQENIPETLLIFSKTMQN